MWKDIHSSWGYYCNVLLEKSKLEMEQIYRFWYSNTNVNWLTYIYRNMSQYSLDGADSLSLLCLELVDSEFKLKVLGIDESSLQSWSTSSGTTGHRCLRLCLTASQLWHFRISQPCLVLAMSPSTYTHVLYVKDVVITV